MTRLSRVHPVNYSTALRSIAQDLELRGLRTLDINSDATGYVVYCGYQAPPAQMPVTLHYTSVDIDELNRGGQEKRGKSSPAKEFVSLVQILRAIGGYLDKNGGRLIRLSNNHPRRGDSFYSVEYETQGGERVLDDREGAAIYDMCVSMYKQRAKVDRPSKFAYEGR